MCSSLTACTTAKFHTVRVTEHFSLASFGSVELMKTFFRLVSLLPGMSTLAGMLLMYFGEEETFWAMNILLTDKKVSFELLKKTQQRLS